MQPRSSSGATTRRTADLYTPRRFTLRLDEDLSMLDETAVVDSFSLYSVATGHCPGARSLKDSAENGGIHLITSAVALAVAASMRTCWDSTCGRGHPVDTGSAVEEFCGGRVEVVGLTPGQALSAGRLYAGCEERRIGGAEVLAACHSVLLAEAGATTLVSTTRATYCYVGIPGPAAARRLLLV